MQLLNNSFLALIFLPVPGLHPQQPQGHFNCSSHHSFKENVWTWIDHLLLHSPNSSSCPFFVTDWSFSRALVIKPRCPFSNLFLLLTRVPEMNAHFPAHLSHSHTFLAFLTEPTKNTAQNTYWFNTPIIPLLGPGSSLSFIMPPD